MKHDAVETQSPGCMNICLFFDHPAFVNKCDWEVHNLISEIPGDILLIIITHLHVAVSLAMMSELWFRLLVSKSLYVLR